MAHLVNAERVTKAYGTRTLLDEVSLGLSSGDVVGVVGRNGDGKSTLLNLLVGVVEPDAGQVVRSASASLGHLTQTEAVPPSTTVRDAIVGGHPDHVWAADAYSRGVVEHLLGEVPLDAEVAVLSGGERRRVALVALMLGQHDLIVLDEPTNHLDVEAVAWLAAHLAELRDRGTAMLVVSHDRWFLDAVCTRVWEVHDGTVDAYDGGYAAYVLARVERQRQAASNEQRRRNLARKELAWLRRGAPARTAKPKFRIEAANALISDVPVPRDTLALKEFAVTRLGKDVFDLTDATLDLPDDGRRLLGPLTWSIGPGDRIGLVGVNGSGKSTLLRLLAGEQAPTSGRVKRGKTLRLAHLTQDPLRQAQGAGSGSAGGVGAASGTGFGGAAASGFGGAAAPGFGGSTHEPLDEGERVLESVTRLRNETRLATGRELSASQLLEDFGFTGERLVTRIGELSGGERRRLQLLRLLLTEPNVLLLDEPTNDLDIDTLTVVEDHLDTWPGTLVVVSHDRYFLERVCDVTYALMGDGRCVLLPGGVEQYLEHRRARPASSRASGAASSAESRGSLGGGDAAGPATTGAEGSGLNAAELRAAKKELARLESQLGRVGGRIQELHREMAARASDYAALGALQETLDDLTDEQAELELAWLEVAERVG